MLMRDQMRQIKMGSSPVIQLSIEDLSNAKGQVSWYKLLTNPYFIWTKFRIKKGQGRSYFCHFFVNQPQHLYFIFFKVNSELDSKPFSVKVSYLNWIDLLLWYILQLSVMPLRILILTIKCHQRYKLEIILYIVWPSQKCFLSRNTQTRNDQRL